MTRGAEAATASHSALRGLLQDPQFRVDGERLNRHLSELAQFGRTPDGGISRVAYSEADLAARRYVRRLMVDAGLEPSIDVAGNIIGLRPGRVADLPPLMLGSHIDSVPQGGNYDGQVGSMGAIEVAHTLVDLRVSLRHPVEIVIFQNEEGGKTGSRSLSGEVDPSELDLVTHSGHTIRDGIRILGGDPARLAEAKRDPGDISAYVELHIEQGGVLERERIEIGVVEGIVGIKRWHVTIEGYANHAGTTPMENRRDALLAAARFVEGVNRIATRTEGRQVATVGQLQVSPGAPNVIPGHATLTLELRDLEMGKIDRLYGQIEAESQELARAMRTPLQFDQFYVSRAALTDRRIRQAIADAATRLGHSTLRMPSGAGHDAQSIARLAPVGMIFIPSVAGISHSPREFSHPRHIVAGANVLLHTLLRLDRSFS
ncbi:MAG: Zn-dependent hydrolase [Gemmatimonadales bacterium]